MNTDEFNERCMALEGRHLAVAIRTVYEVDPPRGVALLREAEALAEDTRQSIMHALLPASMVVVD